MDSDGSEDAKPVPPTKPLTLWEPGYKLTQEELEVVNRAFVGLFKQRAKP